MTDWTKEEKREHLAAVSKVTGVDYTGWFDG